MVFVHLVPLGLALAFSTVPILAAFVIVLSPARSRSAVPYLIGLICGIFVLAGLAALAAQFVPQSPHTVHQNGVVGIVEIVLGVLLLAVGAFSFLRGRKKAASVMRCQPARCASTSATSKVIRSSSARTGSAIRLWAAN